MSKYPAPAPPYVGPAAHVMHDANGKPWTNNTSPVNRIVMHGTVSPCVKGGARATAAYFKTPGSGGSAHYVVDPGEAVQVVWDSWVAEHAPPNEHSIGVELCDPETGLAARWADRNHTAMLKRAATLVAQLCLAYDVPAVKIGPKQLLAGKRGICGHADVSQAWHQSDHSDPIGFPWAKFMGMVHAERDRIVAAANKPAPAPEPKPVPTPTPAPAPAPDTIYTDADLRIVTQNIHHTLRPAKAQLVLDGIAKAGADVAGLQEAANFQRLIEALPGYASYFPGKDAHPAARQTPIIWRADRFELLDQGWTLEHARGNHRGHLPPEHDAVWVELLDKITGRHVVKINTHTPASTTLRGHPLPLPRAQLYRQGMTRLAALVEQLQHRGCVFLVGDFNIRLGADARIKAPGYPHAVLGDRMRLVYDGNGGTYPATCHGQCFDGCWYIPRPHVVQPAKFGLLAKSPSDHRGVVTTFRIRGA